LRSAPSCQRRNCHLPTLNCKMASSTDISSESATHGKDDFLLLSCKSITLSELALGRVVSAAAGCMTGCGGLQMPVQAPAFAILRSWVCWMLVSGAHLSAPPLLPRRCCRTNAASERPGPRRAPPAARGELPRLHPCTCLTRVRARSDASPHPLQPPAAGHRRRRDARVQSEAPRPRSLPLLPFGSRLLFPELQR
jgi:hypothetical protein